MPALEVSGLRGKEKCVLIAHNAPQRVTVAGLMGASLWVSRGCLVARANSAREWGIMGWGYAPIFRCILSTCQRQRAWGRGVGCFTVFSQVGGGVRQPSLAAYYNNYYIYMRVQSHRLCTTSEL